MDSRLRENDEAVLCSQGTSPQFKYPSPQLKYPSPQRRLGSIAPSVTSAPKSYSQPHTRYPSDDWGQHLNMDSRLRENDEAVLCSQGTSPQFKYPSPQLKYPSPQFKYPSPQRRLGSIAPSVTSAPKSYSQPHTRYPSDDWGQHLNMDSRLRENDEAVLCSQGTSPQFKYTSPQLKYPSPQLKYPSPQRRLGSIAPSVTSAPKSYSQPHTRYPSDDWGQHLNMDSRLRENDEAVLCSQGTSPQFKYPSSQHPRLSQHLNMDSRLRENDSVDP